MKIIEQEYKMLLESIKDITKDGRIVVEDAKSEDIFEEGRKAKKENKKINDNPYKGTRYERDWEDGFRYATAFKDSQYTKSEYAEMLARLQRQLQQARSLGDTEEAKELQKEIDDLKALESGVQDAALSIIRKDDKWKLIGPIKEQELHDLGVEKGFNSYQDALDAIKKYGYTLFGKDSDTEAKITDLTEKAKAARAQGYAADQYEAEIEKLKALDKTFEKGYELSRLISKLRIRGMYSDADKLEANRNTNGLSEEAQKIIKEETRDKKTRDSQRDNIERQIDELEDELEDATGKKKSDIQAKIKELEKQLESVNDAYDEVDWLTLDPLTEKGKEILASMKKEYGDERGEKIFYASKNAGKITGVDSK